MAMVSARSVDSGVLHVLRNDAYNGVVSYSRPSVYARGGLAQFEPSVSGAEYIVASWGNDSFYSYNLAEKVWMALGLSPRCVGGDRQMLYYDDLSLPEFDVASGEISTEYYFSPKRNVSWTMANTFLRRYLWMRGAYGVRVFLYEAILPDVPELRALMADDAEVCLRPDDGWYEVDIREHKDGLLVQVAAAVPAVSPELCPVQSAEGMVWPGVAGPMTSDRANALVRIVPVYLDDRFLERYEQNGVFTTTPVIASGLWYCSPSYRRQWTFTDCVRVGRNLIRVPMRELYKPKPEREILHAHVHALNPAQVANFDTGEEHIVSKTARFLDQLLFLADQLAGLSGAIGAQSTVAEFDGFSRQELTSNGWLNYPELRRLAQVAPIAMTEQAFLARCKHIHEFWQRIPNGTLRNLVVRAGHAREKVKDLGSIKLLQALSNIVERLNASGEQEDAFGAGADPSDLTEPNTAIAPLFINNDLRIADAHGVGDVLKRLEGLGFDAAELNDGYGRALDHVFDKVIGAFLHLNTELAKLRSR